MSKRKTKPLGNPALKKRVTVSIAPDVLASAKLRAQSVRRTLSNHVEVLIERDVNSQAVSEQLAA